MIIYIRNQPNAFMLLNATDEQEVLQVVNHIKWKSSKDFESIDMVIVKKVISQVVKPLTVIFNNSFETAIVPDKMKVAKVIPLFKAGDKNMFSNYWLVSLLPQFSKIL